MNRRSELCCAPLLSMPTATPRIFCWARLIASSARLRWRTANSNWQHKFSRPKPEICRVEAAKSYRNLLPICETGKKTGNHEGHEGNPEAIAESRKRFEKTKFYLLIS